jgi:hypothetical protein
MKFLKTEEIKIHIYYNIFKIIHSHVRSKMKFLIG